MSSGDCTKDEGFRSSSSSNLRNTKKQKVIEVEETLEDRISELPDSLLVQILSFLRTRYAVRTCILSKRWHYLWTSVDCFFFTARDCAKTENSVSSFVDYVFAHSVSLKLKKLELDCSFWPYSRLHEYVPRISRSLSLAVEKKVENVVLSSVDESSCTLPESFCSCSSLITLDSGCPFSYDGVIAWKSLKSIKLENMVLEDDEIVKLLSGCPALETMELDTVDGFRRLEIKSLKLKRLNFKEYWMPSDGNDHSLEIIAPYLQHLEISGELYDLKCRLVDVSSVVNAKLTFNITCIKDLTGEEIDAEDDNCRDYHHVFLTLVQDYLQKLSCAAELTIGTWFTQALCILQFKRMPIPELKCKYLTLELHMGKFNLYGVAGLLRASPHVETLNIDIATMHWLQSDKSLCHFELRYLDKGDNIDLQSLISSFGYPSLKKVRIVISLNWCFKNVSVGEFEKFSKLSEFLLMTAMDLEKFIIISKRIKCRKCSLECVSQYFSRLAEKPLGCPRSSTKCVIIFKE